MRWLSAALATALAAGSAGCASGPVTGSARYALELGPLAPGTAALAAESTTGAASGWTRFAERYRDVCNEHVSSFVLRRVTLSTTDGSPLESLFVGPITVSLQTPDVPTKRPVATIDTPSGDKASVEVDAPTQSCEQPSVSRRPTAAPDVPAAPKPGDDACSVRVEGRAAGPLTAPRPVQVRLDYTAYCTPHGL